MGVESVRRRALDVIEVQGQNRTEHDQKSSGTCYAQAAKLEMKERGSQAQRAGGEIEDHDL
jgi:hypothetical protein